MSGRKQFDEDQVLDAAMLAFWRSGYEATSVADLEAATGLSKSSLYNAFGNKDDVFLRCLERFSELYGHDLVTELDQDDFHSAIRAFFDRLIARFANRRLPNGCLATMAALEVGRRQGLAAKHVRKGLDSMRAVFESRCARAVRDGQLPRDTDCFALSTTMLALTRGIAVLNRGHPDAHLLTAAVDGFLASLRGLSDSAASAGRR
ncbi:MAG: TetR/AcrR family transcriptional regulator [Pseudomonadota bacterium]